MMAKNQKIKFKLNTIASLMLPISAMLATPSFAQSETEEENADKNTVETILVTARKTEETLRETPLAVSVLDADFFEKSAVDNVGDAVKFVSGFDYSPTNTTRANGTKIRGISTFSFSDGFESSVATVIDGVVMGREAQGFFDLFDVESVEVIKGPQGTLFGKNASAGVVNVRTKKPSFEFEAGGDVLIGSFNQRRFRGTVSDAIVEDKLAYRFSGTINKFDGKLDNALEGQEDVNDKDTWALRSKFLYDPGSNFNALLILDTVREDNKCCLPTYRVAGEPTALVNFALNNTDGNVQQLRDALNQLGIVASESNRSVGVFDDRIKQESESNGISLQLNYNFDWATFSSQTAWRDWEIDEFNEADQLSLSDINNRNGTQSSSEQFSQEFTLSGSLNDDFIDFVSGFYYFDQDLDADGTVFIEVALPFPPFFNSANNAKRSVKTKSQALYSEFTFNLTDEFSFIVGGRYTRETLNASYEREGRPIDSNLPSAPFFGPDFTGEQEVKDNNLSGRAILRYFLSDTTMTYASWSRGYKGAGIDVAESANINAIAQPGGLPVLPPEIPTLWEIGLKTQFFDNSLTLNTAAFNQSVRNLQAISSNAEGTVLNLSINEVLSKGLEADIFYYPKSIEGLSFVGSVTYLDVAFEKFSARPALEGTPYSDVPRWATSLITDYEFELSDLGYTGFARLEWAWQSEKNTSLQGTMGNDIDPYSLYNLRVGFVSPRDTYTVTLAVENLTDEDYPFFIGGSSYSSLDGTTTTQYLGDPRTFSLNVAMKF